MRSLRHSVLPLFVLPLLACSGSSEPEPAVPTPTPPTASASAVVAPPVTATATAAAAAPRPAPRAGTSLLPRVTLFGNPDHLSPKVSPDGKLIAFIAPDEGVLNIWVGPASDPKAAKPVTHDRVRGITTYEWTYSDNHLLYTQDKGGDENFHLYLVSTDKIEVKDLTPMEGIRAQIEALSPKVKKAALVGINNRDPKNHDLYRVDLDTGKLTLVAENKQGYVGYLADDDLDVRIALNMLPDGSEEMLVPDPKTKGAWVSNAKIPSEDVLTTNPYGFDKSGKTLYLIDSRGRDTAALVSLDMKSGKSTVLAENPRADMNDVLLHPTEHKVQAVASTRERATWKVLDRSIQADFDALAKVAPGDFQVTSRSLDDKVWVVAYVLDDGPVRYYRYDRPSKKAELLFTNRKALEGVKLAKMHPVTIKARDGLELVSYLSLPVASDPDGDGKPDKPVPMVLNVHGGPWARDTWGLNSIHQWLADRGYAVLSVNYRSSTGFGKKFINAGDHEWAGKAHDDLLDAVKWAIDQHIADPAKVAIHGGSYGGYATLVGLTFTPDVFACGVDIVGPSNLATLLSSIPPYWAPMFNLFAGRIGDPRTEDGKMLLADRSPLFKAASIRKPLLIGQGANDPRVKQAESDQIVKAMKEKGIPVTYVLFSDEGHGFKRPENRMSFNAIDEIFLAQCLGGTYQPIGDDFKGSTVAVPEGADQIYSLGDALPKK
ncbi:MAG: S9 family peptidase [Byssovorax sp.]